MTEPTNLVPAHCRNCDTPLVGEYCASCGQHDREVRRPFLYFLSELMRVLLELDGRAYRTVWYLLTRPGFLTREYFSGRRVSYTPPLRLFLVISVGFFLLVGMTASIQSMRESVQSSAQATLEEDASQEGLLRFTRDGEDISSSDLDDDDLEGIRELIANLRLPFLSEQRAASVKQALTIQVESNIETLLEDPADFLLGSLEYVTVFMLLMMPLLAFIQRVLYVFNGNYFVEHLVLTLHNHAFLILAFFLVMVLGMLEEAAGAGALGGLLGLVGNVAVFWMILYLYLSLKFYFGRGHLLTSALFLAASLAYGILLGIGIALFAVLVFIFS